MPFNSGYRAKRANDTQGIVGPQSQFLQKTFPRPYITGYAVSGSDDTALDPAGGQTILVNGGNFSTGVSAVVDGVQIGSVTLISSNQISFTTPAKASGSYTLIVYNPSSDSAAILVPGLIYSGVPTFTTPAGSIGTVYETTAINTSVVATSDSALTYAVTSGSIPTGATFYANGVMTGTAPADSGSTTYTFAVTATDAELQDTTRTFTLTVNTDVVTWSNPASGSTIALDTSAYSTTLLATSAAGYNVSYAANALPAGLTLTGNTISGTATTEGSSSTLLTATAATSNRTATNTISWIVTFGDSFLSYVTTLLSTGTPLVYPFNDDASTNNFVVTPSGDTRPNNFNPYTPGYYSVFFDAKTDYISVPATTALTTFTGNFTFEAWVYPTDTSVTYWKIWDSRQNGATAQAMVLGMVPLASPVTGQGRLEYFNGSTYLGTGIVYYNKWTHIAYVRSGTTMTFYVDGIAGGTATISGTQTGSATTNPIWIGTKDNGLASYGTTGYLSNFRIVNGTAVYTANFTPSTEPLTAIANTALLTCQSNRFVDNSTNNYTLTPSSVSISGFDPYLPVSNTSTYGSTYFDGSGDYLRIPNNEALQLTANFTIEFWIYTTSLSSSQRVVVKGNQSSNDYSIDLNTTGTFGLNNGSTVATSTGSIGVNSWNHIALTRNGSTCTWWINGESKGTFTYTNSLNNTSEFWIGQNQSTGLNLVGYLSNFRVVKGTAVYTANFTPPTEPLTAITNTSLLTCQTNQPVNNNMFLDSSTNNSLIIRNGNTTQGTFSPYGENWSNYFDGTGDYLSLPSSSSFSFGTGNFTVEAWVYYSTKTNSGIFQIGSSVFPLTNGVGAGLDASTNWLLYYGNGSQTAAGSGPLNGIWYHVATVRNSGVTRVYVNGTQVISVTDTANYTGTFLGIGGIYSTSYLINGYISNFRIVNGTALYTANFTPSTTPLQPVSGTVLLTCRDPNFVDDSANNFAITRAGDVRVQKFGPFAGTTLPVPNYSAYFDGSGDNLQVASGNISNFGTADFTIECWIYPSTTATYQGVFESRPDSTDGLYPTILLNNSNVAFWVSGAARIAAAFTTNTWTHVAVVRTSGVSKMYLNGTQVGGNYTDTNNYLSRSNPYIGSLNGGGNPVTGYISNLRVVKGTAVYTANFTPSTSPLTAIAGTSLLTCQSRTFVDNSPNNFTITATGNTKPSTYTPFSVTYSTKQSYTPSVFGGSMYFDGTGDYLTVPYNTNFLPGSGTDFTAECWIYITGATAVFSHILGMNNNTVNNWYIKNENGSLQGGIGSAFGTFGTAAANTWIHLAITQRSNTLYGYINGVQAFTSAITTWNSNVLDVTIGARSAAADRLFTGYISNARVVKGTAVYTSNFVPQNKPLIPVQNSTLLLNGTGAGIYDSSEISTYETVADAKLSHFGPYNGSYYSNYFDGTGDRLTITNNGAFDFGSGDFTIEAWVNPQSFGNLGLVFFANFIPSSFRFVTYLSATGVGVDSGGQMTFSGTTACSVGTWYHCALVRSGSSFKTYINGILVSTATYSNPYWVTAGTSVTVGDYSDDYSTAFGIISNLRVVKGTAVYTANFTPPTSPLTAISGTSLLTCQSNKFVDNSTNNFIITRVGDTRVATQNPFQINSGQSIVFDGTGDYVLTPTTQTLSFETGDFTVECWVYLNSFGASYVPIFNNAYLFYVGASGQMLVYNGSADVATGPNGAVSLNSWFYLSWVRTSGTIKMFVNGVQSGSNATVTASIGSGSPNRIGAHSSAYLNGYISDLRITKGVARYTANFTPPTSPFSTK